jgi:[ribosomal protein S5]-alanine N-acetyltransferase
VVVKDPTSTLSTERLRLRRFTPGDLELLVRLNGDERVMRYAGGVKTREQTGELLRGRILQYYEEHPGMGVWATIERDSGACIGMHLLNHIQGESFIQVGYLLLPEFWGKGYATEMCRAVLRYGFAGLGLPRIVAITNMDNVDSQRVLLKAGLERNGERALPHPAYASSGPLAWFERDGASWLAQDAGRSRTP